MPFLTSNQQHQSRHQTAINYELQNSNKLECGPMPNVMVALLNIVGALCSTPQTLADADYLTAVQ